MYNFLLSIITIAILFSPWLQLILVCIIYKWGCVPRAEDMYMQNMFITDISIVRKETKCVTMYIL